VFFKKSLGISLLIRTMVAASGRYGAGFAEVLLEEHPTSRTVCAAGARDSRVSTTHADVAGGVQLVGANGEKRRLLSWSIRRDDGAALRLTETPCAGKGSRSHALRIVFPRQLLPIAAIVETDPHSASRDGIAAGVRVVVVDVGGAVHVVRAPHPAELEATPGRRAEASLASVRDAQDVHTVHDSPALSQLEGVSSVCPVGPRLLAFGGMTGRIALLDALSDDLTPIAELKPATLARLWNVVSLANTRGGAQAIRALSQVPSPRRQRGESPRLLLAALRSDCHLQLWDVTSASKPISLVSTTLPQPPHEGGYESGGGSPGSRAPDSPGSSANDRAAHCMGCGDGYVAVSTYNAKEGAKEGQFPRPRTGKVSVYALDVKVGAEGSSSASVAFHSPVVGSSGKTTSLVVSGESLWALQEAPGRRKDASGRLLDSLEGDDYDVGRRVLKGWPLESLNRPHPCETLGDAATALDGWAGDSADDAGAAGAAAALLLRGAAVPGSGNATAADVSDDLAGELATRGVASNAVLSAALDLVEQPSPAGVDVVERASRATRFAAGGDDAPAADAVAAWSLIAPAYARCWRGMRAPLGILCGAGTAAVVVRDGACSVMRSLDATEASASAAALAARSPGFAENGGSGSASNPGGMGALPHLAALALGCHLNDLLGSPACHAMDLVAGGAGAATGSGSNSDRSNGQSSASGMYRASVAARAAVKEAAAFAATEDWLDAAVALALGRVTQQPRGGMDDTARAALRERRARQRRAAGTLRVCLARLGSDPTRAIARALDSMDFQPVEVSAEGEDSSEGAGEWAEGARAQAARQQAGARCDATRGLLLLLGAIRWGGARVGAPPGCDARAAVMIPRAAAQHRAALLARWLTATPCVGAAAERVAPAPAPPLSAAILPSNAASARPGLPLTVAGAALCAEIVLGAAGVSHYRVEDGGYRRAVEIGAELYAGGELDALGRVLKQARAAPPGGASDQSMSHDAPALLFLQALRASANIALGGASSDASTEEALGLFFRAASGIEGGGDESPGVNMDADTSMDVGTTASDGSDPLLQHLVKLLRSIMSGFPAGGIDDGEIPPVSTLEYYETLMLFFERLGCSLGAMRCAHAALREVERAHPEDQNRRTSRAARLWANLLQYALDLGDWSGAYAAVLSVPTDDAQNAALRRLVAALCEPGDVRGGAAALVSLPLGVDRLPVVVRALEGRAAAAPIDASPNPAIMRRDFAAREAPRRGGDCDFYVDAGALCVGGLRRDSRGNRRGCSGASGGCVGGARGRFARGDQRVASVPARRSVRDGGVAIMRAETSRAHHRRERSWRRGWRRIPRRERKPKGVHRKVRRRPRATSAAAPQATPTRRAASRDHVLIPAAPRVRARGVPSRALRRGSRRGGVARELGRVVDSRNGGTAVRTWAVPERDEAGVLVVRGRGVERARDGDRRHPRRSSRARADVHRGRAKRARVEP
jgi:nuclear pore complex protein Nup160